MQLPASQKILNKLQYARDVYGIHKFVKSTCTTKFSLTSGKAQSTRNAVDTLAEVVTVFAIKVRCDKSKSKMLKYP